jgi:hypothetical protein
MEHENQPTSVQVDLWKQKAIEGTMTEDEGRQAIAILRQGRANAAIAGAAKKAKAGPVDVDALLGELDSL